MSKQLGICLPPIGGFSAKFIYRRQALKDAKNEITVNTTRTPYLTVIYFR